MSRKNVNFLIVLLWTALFSVRAWRIFLGVDFTDEAFYASLAVRIAEGVPPFSQEISLHQTFALISAPCARFLYWVTGSYDFLIFSLRAVSLGLDLAVSLAVARLLSLARLLSSPQVSLPQASSQQQVSSPSQAETCFSHLIGMALFMLVAYPIPTFSYNHLAGLLLPLWILLAENFSSHLSAQESEPADRSLLSGWRGQAVGLGLLGAMIVISYPPLALFIGVSVLLLTYGTNALLLTHSTKRFFFIIFCVAFAIALAPLVYSLVAAGPEKLRFAFELTQIMGEKGGSLKKIFNLLYDLWRFCLKLIPILLGYWILLKASERRGNEWFRANWMPILMIALTLRFFNDPSKILLSLALLVVFAVTRAQSGKIPMHGSATPHPKTTAFHTIAPGFLTAWGSANGIANFFVGGSTVLTSWRAIPQNLSRMFNLALLILLSAFTFKHVSSLYRDNIGERSMRVASGPYRGLYTNPTKAEILSELETLTFKLADQKLIFLFDFPAGSLFTPQISACTSWFLSRDWRAHENLLKQCLHVNADETLWVVPNFNPREAQPKFTPGFYDKYLSMISSCETIDSETKYFKIIKVDAKCFKN